MHYIMSKDIPIIEIETVKIINRDMVPLALNFRNMHSGTIQRWIQHRALPLNRANADKIYKTLNLPSNADELDIMYLTHSISINDNYWIADEKEINTLKYEDISLFRNKFKEEMYQVALAGKDGFTITENFISAEYTGQGTFPKCFMREYDGIYMYKSGSKISINNELASSIIAKILNFKSVQYEYTKVFDMDCTKSKIVSNENVNWETAFIISEALSERKTIPQEFALQYFTAEYCNMIIFDAIVLNEDRHMKNWALEFNSDTNKIIGLAPSFDYNNTFIADIHTMSNLLFDGMKKNECIESRKRSI